VQITNYQPDGTQHWVHHRQMSAQLNMTGSTGGKIEQDRQSPL